MFHSVVNQMIIKHSTVCANVARDDMDQFWHHYVVFS